MSGFEMLESRRMMAVLVGSDLQITGTDANDTIKITQNDAATLRVEENGAVTFFSDASVTTIHVNAGKGNDRVEFVASSANGTANEAATLVGGEGNDTLIAGGGADSLDGGAGDDSLRGGTSNDRLNGGVGNNQLFGEAGNDSLTAGTGSDLYDGGDGTDLADYSVRTSNLSISLDDVANDGQFLQSSFGTPTRTFENDNVKSNVENVTTGSGNDSINAGTVNVANVFFGGAGNDKLRGRAGNDSLNGQAGNDVLFGAGQNDSISAGDGNDIADGGAGNDVVSAGAGDDVVSGGLGIDQLFGEAGDDVLITADGAVDQVIDGGAGTDFLSGDSNDVFSNVEITE